MSHANKLANLSYSKKAHSEWSLLQKWEADLEKLSIQERKDLLAKLKVSSTTQLFMAACLHRLLIATEPHLASFCFAFCRPFCMKTRALGQWIPAHVTTSAALLCTALAISTHAQCTVKLMHIDN